MTVLWLMVLRFKLMLYTSLTQSSQDFVAKHAKGDLKSQS